MKSIGMKKLSLLLFLTVFVTGYLFAQETVSEESVDMELDSLATTRSIKDKAADFLDAIFKPVPELNNADSIVKTFDDMPSFSIYKNNYIVTGTTIGKKPTRENSDAKFQISVVQRLTNSVLPFRTYLFLTYTQLAYWDIYQESFPFGDINFNPSIGLGKALAYRNRFLGLISLQLEHESNGRDGDESRSWNKISFNSLFKFDDYWSVQSKLSIPFVDGGNNRDIVSYKGWGHIAIDYNRRKKYNIGLLVTKRAGGLFDANVTANFSYRLFKNENQYFFVEYYNGYGENMLDYKEYRHMLRIGFVIQPNFLHMY